MNVFGTIRGKLLAATAAIVLTAIGGIGFLASRVSRREFRRIALFHVVNNSERPQVVRRVLENGSVPLPESSFDESVDRWIFVTVVVVGVASLLAVAFVTRRLLRPVESLTKATKRLESGDLGTRVLAENRDEIGELARAFNRMAERLDRNDKARKDMVSDVAHELRSPLTNIRAQIEAIQDGLVLPNSSVVASLHEEALLLGRLVDDLQQLSLLDAGQLTFDRKPFALRDPMESAIQALRLQAERAHVSLELELPAELPQVVGDRERIGQVLRNLIANAITHSAIGGRVIVRARSLAAEIETEVSDNGEGIPAEHLPHLFERFYRADPSRSRSSGGAGLGLPIVQRLVEACGGSVRVESVFGSGSAFFFTLPRDIT